MTSNIDTPPELYSTRVLVHSAHSASPLIFHMSPHDRGLMAKLNQPCSDLQTSMAPDLCIVLRVSCSIWGLRIGGSFGESGKMVKEGDHLDSQLGIMAVYGPTQLLAHCLLLTPC